MTPEEALNLRPGQVVATTYFTNKLGGGFNVNFKAPKGKRFAFIFLGLEDDENPVEPTVILDKLGWQLKKDKSKKSTKKN